MVDWIMTDHKLPDLYEEVEVLNEYAEIGRGTLSRYVTSGHLFWSSTIEDPIVAWRPIIDRNHKQWWFLRSTDSLEYAVVYAYSKEIAFEKLKAKRNIQETNFSNWEIETLNPHEYDGIIYFS